MPRDPHIIGAARPIAGASIIWPIANRDGYRTWVRSAIIRSSPAIIRSISRRSRIITTASRCTDQAQEQKSQQSQVSRSGSCLISGRSRLRVSEVNNVRFHIVIIRFRQSFYAPAFSSRMISTNSSSTSSKSLSRQIGYPKTPPHKPENFGC